MSKGRPSTVFCNAHRPTGYPRSTACFALRHSRQICCAKLARALSSRPSRKLIMSSSSTSSCATHRSPRSITRRPGDVLSEPHLLAVGVEFGPETSRSVRYGGGFPSSRCGARCLRCSRRRAHRPAQRRPAGAGPRRGRTGARRASRAGWPEPAGCGRHQRRREPTAAPFGCRRSGATRQPDVRRRGNVSRRWNNTAVSLRR